MDGITDHPFRQLVKKYGQPDVIYTEFTSVEGLCHGASRLLKDFLYDETQRPIVAQLFGTTPKFFQQAAVVACELGFDGIDVNMGCPAKGVIDYGAGAALIQTPQLAQQIVKAVQQGIIDFSNGQTSHDCPDISESICREVDDRTQSTKNASKSELRKIPISIKTRLGYDKIVTHDWISTLLETKPDLIAIHGRILKQGHGGEVYWEEIAQAANLIHQAQALVLGNGNVNSYQEAVIKTHQYQLDGALIGRAALGNPFVFQKDPSPIKNIYQIALEHARLYELTYQNDEKYNFLPMRKHLGWYVREIANAGQIRAELMATNSSHEVATVFKKYSLI